MVHNLFIVRHGNTFDPGETVLRVGSRTDLKLSNSGRQQAEQLGLFFKKFNQTIKLYTSELRRTQETAQLILKALGQDTHFFEITSVFNEIDYGPDEGRPESEVIERLSARCLQEWEERASIPPGWIVNPSHLIQTWKNFSNEIYTSRAQNLVVVTSQSIAKFAPAGILQIPDTRFRLKTGGVSHFQYDSHTSTWHLKFWNQKPDQIENAPQSVV